MYKPQREMKPKKLKLELNKETITKLNDLEMENVNGGEKASLTGFSFLCLATKISCVSMQAACPGDWHTKRCMAVIENFEI